MLTHSDFDLRSIYGTAYRKAPSAPARGYYAGMDPKQDALTFIETNPTKTAHWQALIGREDV